VSLDLGGGAAVGIEGSNGAGKTTLLRIVAGLITPDSGEVFIDGLAAGGGRMPYRRQVGLVSAGNGALYARLSVDDHLRLWSRMALLEPRERETARARMLEEFALEELRRHRMDRLSTGQRQRLRLALGFMHDPAVVCLDEPDHSLDEDGIRLLSAAIERRVRAGGLVLACSPGGVHPRLPLERRFVVSGGRLEAA
jgi:ABC-2 type transport system ATP-binding protein